MRKWLVIFLSILGAGIGMTIIFYITLHYDYSIYIHGNKAAIINQFKLAEREHKIFSGEHIIAIAESIQKNNTLTEFNKLDLMRELIYQQVLNNQINTDILDTNKILFQSKTPKDAISNIINTMNEKNKGIRCAGTGTILALIYRIMGYHAWLYAYGSSRPDSHLTHTITLVELNKKIYLEDAYFNSNYVDKNNNMLPFEEVLKSNKQRKKIFLSEGQLNYRRNIMSPNSQSQPLCAALKIDPTSPIQLKIKNIFWMTYHSGVFPCIIKSRNEEAEEMKILSNDYKDIKLIYLVNYPIWLTDMQTLVYYPLNKYKENKLFITLKKASNRSR